MPNFYIDTSSLKWRYVQGAPTSQILAIFNRSTESVFTSEWTMLEWSSALARAYRKEDIDQHTYKTNEILLMRDISSRRLKIVPMTRSIERARYLIEYVGVILKLNLRSGDALQAVTALDVAARSKEALVFLTSDNGLAYIINNVDTFHPTIKAAYLPPY